jgi:flagellar biosynthesis protein FlhA
VPKQLPLGVVQRVLQNLLEEGVTLRDMRTIIETLAEHAPRTQDPLELTAQVRVALGRSIVQQLYPGNAEMQVMALDPRSSACCCRRCRPVGPDGSGIEPGLADTLLRETAAAAQRQEEVGLPPVLLVPGQLRWLLSRFLRRAVPQLKVIANAEVPDSRTIKVTSIIGGRV